MTIGQPDFSLAEFLRDNHALLTLLGVFGGLAIYLGNPPGTSGENALGMNNSTVSTNFNTEYAEIGILSSFLLFLTVSYIVCVEFVDDITSDHELATVFVGQTHPVSILFLHLLFA